MAEIVEFSPAWRDRLQRSSTGGIRTNLHNAVICVRALNLPVFYDEFRMELIVEKPLPWDDHADRPWTERDDGEATLALQRMDVQTSTQTVAQAIDLVARSITRHPVREYLSALTWDGVSRVDGWLHRHLGVQDTAYSQAVGQMWLISAVARIMRPGCKVDHTIVLEGPKQGRGKSSALASLCPRPEWFSDSLPPITDNLKEARQHLRGVWIVEIAEMAAMRKSSAETIKSFLSCQSDRYRPSYGRREIVVPRQCVFSGSVNLDQYLIDPTGNRRFWPVLTGEINVEAIRSDRDQLWAEAVYLFSTGCKWWPDTSEFRDVAAVEQNARVAVPLGDPRLWLREFVETETMPGWRPDGPGDTAPQWIAGEMVSSAKMLGSYREWVRGLRGAGVKTAQNKDFWEVLSGAGFSVRKTKTGNFRVFPEDEKCVEWLDACK